MVVEREYFYRIDGEGRLFHDGTELTDLVFLDFFFSRLTENHTGRHENYRFVSPCGREMNYLDSMSAPIVFRHLLESTGEPDRLQYAGNLFEVFHPERLRHDAATGQLYHPLARNSRIEGRIGRHLLYELSASMQQEKDGLVLRWKGERIPLA